jgi:hypothetical protein
VQRSYLDLSAAHLPHVRQWLLLAMLCLWLGAQRQVPNQKQMQQHDASVLVAAALTTPGQWLAVVHFAKHLATVPTCGAA